MRISVYFESFLEFINNKDYEMGILYFETILNIFNDNFLDLSAICDFVPINIKKQKKWN